MRYSFVRVRVKILTGLWHRNSINHFAGVSHNICPLTGEMYVCLVVFRFIAECIHRVQVLQQTTNSSLRQNNRKLMICWTRIGPCSTWYTFELQDNYMYLFLDHDWINLSKSWLFNYFSLWIPNRPTGLPSTLWCPVPVVLLHYFNWPTHLWHHIPVHQHLPIWVPWMLTILHHFLLVSDFPYISKPWA